MFCDSCGAKIEAGQHFCSTCGKAVGMALMPRVVNRVAQHRKVLGVLWATYSLFHLIAAAVLFIVANTVMVHMGRAPAPPEMPGGYGFLQPLLSFIGVLVLGVALLGLAAGIGLLQKQQWARMIALIAGFIALLNIPLGTALGIYTIWVLMSSNAEEEYSKLAAVA